MCVAYCCNLGCSYGHWWLFLVFLNFKNTNLVYGLGGSAVQLAVFSVLAYFGVVYVILGLVIHLLGSRHARRVYVVNK